VSLVGPQKDIALPSKSGSEVAPHASIKSSVPEAAMSVSGSISTQRRIAWLGAAFALVGSALLIDPFAEAAFDAPKRSCVIAGATLGALALLWDKSRIRRANWASAARWAFAFALLLLVWALIATIDSPHPEIAWTSFRRAVLIALCLPIGASYAVDSIGARRLFIVFVCSCSANAAISLLQTFGFQMPVHIVQLGGRFPTGALLGNEGYVALASSIMGAACAAVVASDVSRRFRIVALGIGAMCVLVIALNRQATSAIAFFSALTMIAAVRWRMRWIAVGLGCLIAISAGTALISPLRAVTWSALPVGSIEGYQRLTSYRLGAWVAAIDMVEAHPLTGYGLGTFAAEQQTHRLQKEVDMRERFVQPTGATFVYTHDEYLQLAAEAGIPALIFALGALTALLIGLVRLQRPPADAERLVLLAALTTGAVAAIAWFPLQIPFTTAVLLLAAGRAWRVVAEDKAP
jgi:O-antigen ligase